MPNYTTPPTATAGYGLAAADWNTKIRDSLEDVAKPKRAKVNRTTVLSIPNNIVTAITYVNEEYDSDNLWVVGTPDTLTIPPGGAGLWRFILNAQFAINATGARHLSITQNGTIKGSFNNAGNAAWYVGGCVVAEFICVVGDAIKTLAYQTSGGALNLDNAYPITFSGIQLAR